ncbi:hypothetical protein [Parahaliea mediterranea]|uniref:Calx-beta domain-containing protein n=1 Tax=Parahaliea mediterranea TaxID=651086 RepID=A0A939DCJ7_9GAMM|nr:hypothetical protein [Parahaliea mediterranea]MBN7795082.1 hypothetical protein [Parahaliea mediterranea]
MRPAHLLFFTACLSVPVQAAVLVNTEPTTLITHEDGSSVTYWVYLDQAPSAGETVTVTPSSGDVTEGTVSGGPLTFTDANWDTPQSVTVTPGASGDGNDGDVMYTISQFTTATGGTASFNGAFALDVDVTNRNIEGINTVLMSPASGTAFYLDEGSSQTVTLTVTGAPTSDISIDVSIAGGEATVSTSTVTLQAGNGYSATFDVTAVADAAFDADQAFTVVTDPASSLDGNYNGIDLNDIQGLAINVDAPVREVLLSPANNPLQTSESGGGDSIDMVLSAAPASDVSFSVTVSAPGEAMTSASTITFTPANWNIPQTLNVTGVDDGVADGDANFQILFGNSASADGNWNNLAITAVAGINTDDGSRPAPPPAPQAIPVLPQSLLLGLSGLLLLSGARKLSRRQ